jgi:hypothetical protein
LSNVLSRRTRGRSWALKILIRLDRGCEWLVVRSQQHTHPSPKEGIPTRSDEGMKIFCSPRKMKKVKGLNMTEDLQKGIHWDLCHETSEFASPTFHLPEIIDTGDGRLRRCRRLRSCLLSLIRARWRSRYGDGRHLILLGTEAGRLANWTRHVVVVFQMQSYLYCHRNGVRERKVRKSSHHVRACTNGGASLHGKPAGVTIHVSFVTVHY